MFVAVFLFRSITPFLDAIIALITAALIVVVGLMLVGQRWAGVAFFVFPVAVFASPAGREFSFSDTAHSERDETGGFGALMIVAINSMFPHPGFGQSLTPQAIDSLPVIEMLNYAYDLSELQVVEGETFRAVVNNSTNLPHSLTIDSLDIDVYVPAGRFSIIEIDPERIPGSDEGVPMVCTIGEHEVLGMQRALTVSVVPR